jgi:hypothetical protein
VLSFQPAALPLPAGVLVGLRHYTHPSSWPRTGSGGRRRLNVPLINWGFDIACADDRLFMDAVANQVRSSQQPGCRLALGPCNTCPPAGPAG